MCITVCIGCEFFDDQMASAPWLLRTKHRVMWSVDFVDAEFWSCEFFARRFDRLSIHIIIFRRRTQFSVAFAISSFQPTDPLLHPRSINHWSNVDRLSIQRQHIPRAPQYYVGRFVDRSMEQNTKAPFSVFLPASTCHPKTISFLQHRLPKRQAVHSFLFSIQ